MRHGLVSERELLLVSTTGKSWPVQFFLTPDVGKLNGFSDFARDNGLREGDRCTFKLVKKNTFLVHVVSSTYYSHYFCFCIAIASKR
jgi:B3 DNA binding domain